MRITATNEINRDDLKDAPEGEWIDQLLSGLNEINRQANAVFGGQISVNDNTTSKTKDYVMTHGVTYASVKNPLSVPIQGIFATRAIQLQTNTDGSFTRKTFPCISPTVQWQPSTKQDGSVDITLNFERNHTQPFLVKQSPLFNLASGGGGTKVTGWTSATARGSVISESGGDWTVSEAGTYAITVYNNWEIGGSAYTRALTTLAGVLANTCESDIAVAGTTVGPGPDNTMSTIANLSAGATWSLTALQTNGAGTARTPTFNMQVQRLYNNTSITAKVTLFFVGG